MSSNPTNRPTNPYNPETRPMGSERRTGFGEQERMGEHGKEKEKAEEKSFTEKAKETASSMTSKAGEVASSAATAVGEKAQQGVAAVGSGMQSLAGTIREHVPESGVLGSASSRVARGLESGGRYLEEEGLSGMAEDFTALVRKNPIPAVLISLGIGFLLARTFNRS